MAFKRKIVKSGGKTYEYGSFEISGIQPQLVIDLENISKNSGYNNLSEFIRKILIKERDSHPAEMRKNPEDE